MGFMSDEARAKMRAAWTPERRAAQALRCKVMRAMPGVADRIAESNRGRSSLGLWTAERRAKASERAKKQWSDPEARRKASEHARQVGRKVSGKVTDRETFALILLSYRAEVLATAFQGMGA